MSFRFKIFCLSVLFILSIGLFSSLAAYGGAKQKDKEDLPWLTGTLLAFPGTTIPKGKLLVQPYLFATINHAVYDSHWKPRSIPNLYNINHELFLVAGLTDWMDVQVTPGVFYNLSRGKSSVQSADLPVGMDFQLLKPIVYKWFPGILLSIREILPTGKFRDLDPKLGLTEASGFGSFETNLSLIFFKIYQIKDKHYLSATLALEYYYLSTIHVRGFNIYGGGFGTDGTVRPGNTFTALLSLEYTLTKNWVLAFDAQYVHANRSPFSGKQGVSLTGEPALVGLPSRESISLAPAIEYNFSKTFGILGGYWFTTSGKNTFSFGSFVVSAVALF